MMAQDPVEREFYLRRADAWHTMLFVIGVLLVLQVTAFANLVGNGQLVCALPSQGARVAVFGCWLLFLGAYHFAIAWCARMERAWRARVDVGRR